MAAPRSGALTAMPYAAIATVALADFTSGPEIGLLPLFAVGPAFASTAGRPRRSWGTGAVALLLCLLASWYDGLLWQRRSLVALASVIGVTIGAALAAALRGRTEYALAEVTSVAEAAQRALLRPIPEAWGGLRIAVSYTSAVAAARIGGDLYEVVECRAGTRLIVGDVQGKGLPAVDTAALVLAAFREAAPEAATLHEVGERLERALSRRPDGEEFVTAVLAEIGPDFSATLLNYGHPAPLVMRAGGAAEAAQPETPAAPLGLRDLDAGHPAPQRLRLGPGEQLLLYTDGVTEARDRSGRFYPLIDRIGGLLAASPGATLAALRADLAAHTGGPLLDDAAVMLVLRHSATPAVEAPGRSARHPVPLTHTVSPTGPSTTRRCAGSFIPRQRPVPPP